MISYEIRSRYISLLSDMLACQYKLEVLRRVTIIEGDYESIDLIKDMRQASERMLAVIDSLEKVGDYSEMRSVVDSSFLARVKGYFSGRER
jgi:hypothetical protein